MKNRKILLTKASHFEEYIEEMPQYGDDDVLVRVKHIGVCGSDVAFFLDPTIGGKLDTKLPILLGHECSGEVVAVGKNVKQFKDGDVVALEPGIPCGKCEWCLTGHYNLCPDVDFMAAPPFHRGALSEYVVHPAAFTHCLPTELDTMQGALTEPLSVGMYAAERAKIQPFENIVILGAGCIGLMTLQACRVMGARNIIVVDLYEQRLQKALELGAAEVVQSGQADTPECFRMLFGERGADVVFETAGNARTMQMTAELVRRGGRIVMVGNVYGNTPFPFFEINEKEADIISVFRYRNIYPNAIKAQSDGRIQTKEVVTKVFPFERTQEAFECAAYQKNSVIKVVLEL